MTPDELADLHATCFVTPRPWSAAEFAEFLASAWCFLCTEPGGFVLGRVVAGEAELLTIAVAPDARRQGVARRLLHAFDVETTKRNAEQAFLEVAVDNTPARQLYAAAGWHDAGKRRNYYHTPDGRAIDAVVMVRPQPLHT